MSFESIKVSLVDGKLLNLYCFDQKKLFDLVFYSSF